MPETRLDPTRLQGEALRRWYVRSPEQIERERQAADAREYRMFFGPTDRADPDPPLTRQTDKAPGDVDPEFSRYPGEPTNKVPAQLSGQAYSSLNDGWALDRGLAGTGDGGELIDIGSKSPQHRREWEMRWGIPWPKVPETGQNYHVSHIKPKADGGADTLDNIEPEHPTEHIQRHRENGDFSRWGKRASPRSGPRAKSFGILGLIPNITGILSGRIRTDTPVHFWFDMIGYPSPDDMPPPDYV